MDQWFDVSTTIRPVTKVAEVDVKRQSRKFVDTPEEDEAGNIRANVPIKILMMNARPRPDKGVFQCGTKLGLRLTLRVRRLRPIW